MTIAPDISRHRQRPLAITHVITGLTVGGAERALHSLLTGGLEGQTVNRVISLMDMGHYGLRLREAGIEVIGLDMKLGFPTPAVIVRLRRALRAAPPDIIQGWMYHGNLAASLGARLVPGPPALAWNIRTSMDDPTMIRRSTRGIVSLSARLSSKVKSIVYNSARSQGQHRALGFAGSRDVVIPNGFDMNLWQHGAAARAAGRAELGIDELTVVIGYVGRGALVKDVPTLFRAFAAVRTDHPEAVLVCIGRDIEAQLPADVPAEGIHFLGQRSDVAQLIPAFDLLCLSSRVEGFPNVLGEAMACAVPCVTTNVGDAENIVGDTGWVVPPADHRSYAKALKAALSEGSAARARRGQAARHRIEASYALPTIVARYAEMYRQLGELN